LLDTYFAPSETAVFTEVPRSWMLAMVASTSRMRQLGQIAETMSTSRLISPAQPVSAVGSGLAWPFSLTFLKQPFAVVQAGRPNCERYAARSDSAFGSSCASTIPTVAPLPPVALVRLYALRRLDGP